MILDGDYKYASTEIISGPGFGNSEVESTFVDNSESSNRRKRGLVQVQQFECYQNSKIFFFKFADFDHCIFFKFSGKVYGKFEIANTEEIGLKLNTYRINFYPFLTVFNNEIKCYDHR